jgi:hypothetical protein
MNDRDLEQAAEILGAMKDLFKEFENRLGEVVSTQRIASSEARAEGAKVSKDLHELALSARILVNEQRDLVKRLQQEWQLRIDQNAQRAGEAQAKAFGENIARGLQGQLAELAADVKRSTRRYTWKSSLQWILGIAIAIPLTVGVCLIGLLPQVKSHIEKPAASQAGVELPNVVGLTGGQTRAAVAKMSLCQVPKTNDWHACIEDDNPPRMGLGSVDKPRVAIRGM